MTSKRMVLKLTDEQMAWVERVAADEGIDSATFVRMMIDRLSKGRAPLISQMVEAPYTTAPEGPHTFTVRTELPPESWRNVGELTPQFSELGAADPAVVRAALDREPQQEFVVDWEAAKDTAAISLRKVEWNQYNPLPK